MRIVTRMLAGVLVLSASSSKAQPTGAPQAEPPAPAAPATEGRAEAAEPAVPAEAPAPAPAPAAAPKGPDVSALRSELATLMDELIQARSRASVLVKALFRTRVEVTVIRRADAQQLERIVLRLDGVPVHDSDGTALARDEAKLFDGFAAPGVHELAVSVTEHAKENAAYTYTREERYRFEIKKNTTTRVELVMRDDSDMAEELPEDDEGEYDVSTIVRIEREALED